tara:strand:- start:531 stop:1532 length:1002 start_codon:yes stop_codon:yes gene_type:complete
MSTVTPETSKCVERDDNLITANHQFCVMPPNELIQEHPSNKLGLDNTLEHVGATFRYLGSIVVDKNKICSEDCGYYGCKGNAYVTRAGGAVCTPDGSNPAFPRAGPKVPMYTYKDFTRTKNVISGRENDDSEGQLGSVLSDLTKIITDNDILTAVTDDPAPLCKEVRLSCSVLKVLPNDNTQYYGKHVNGIPGNPRVDNESPTLVPEGDPRVTGSELARQSRLENTGKVHIAYRDLIGEDGLYAQGYVINDEGVVQSEPVSESGVTMAQELENYYRQGITGGTIAPPSTLETDVASGTSGFTNMSNDLNEKIYYFLLCILLSYILYKIIYVKK